MKSILISIRPKWVEKIASGKKTIEVRKTAPKGTPFKAYIYCTRITDKKHCRDEFDVGVWKGNEHVIGEFICDKVYSIKNQDSRFSVADEEKGVTNDIARQSCLDYDDMVSYLGNKDGYGWHISDLKIYDKLKALWQFYKRGAKMFEELSDGTELCEYCKFPSQGLYLCEGRFCDAAYEAYLDCNFTLTRPPQSWQYVEELCKAQN